MNMPNPYNVPAGAVCKCFIDSHGAVAVLSYDSYGDEPALMTADQAIGMGKKMIAMGEWLNRQMEASHDD